MFEPFFSTKEVGRGSGMGLASVHGIVHEHGGHIVVDTLPGKGTTFRVELPALAATAGTPAGRRVAHATGRRSVARPRAAGRRRTHGDRFHGRVAAELGAQGQGQAHSARRRGWFARNAERVQVVVTDQTMPKMTGLELARRLWACRPELPVILYTGYAEGISEAQLAASGVRTLMRKPIEPAELRAKLVELLGATALPSEHGSRSPDTPGRTQGQGRVGARVAQEVTAKTAPRKVARRSVASAGQPSRPLGARRSSGGRPGRNKPATFRAAPEIRPIRRA